MLKSVISVIFLLSIYLPSLMNAAASCAAPTATLTLNSTTYQQEIDQPYIDGDAASGESLYYKINIVENGTLELRTEEDGVNTVNTYGYFLDASCNPIATATKYQDNPRLVETTQSVYAGESYFFKVENNATSSDSVLLAKGFFKLHNTFTKTLISHEILFSKSLVASVDSKEEFTYRIDVENIGTEDTKTVTITDTVGVGLHHYLYSDSNEWNCTQNLNKMTCALNSILAANGGKKSLYFTDISDFLAADTSIDIASDVNVTYNTAGTIDKSDTQQILVRGINPTIVAVKWALKDSSIISSIVQNDTFDYMIKVSNTTTNNKVTESNVTIVDDVDASFTVLSVTPDIPADWDCGATSGQHVECRLVNDLVKGADKGILIKVQATGAVKADAYHNTGTVTADTPLGTSINHSTTIPISIVNPSYTILFTKTNPDNAVAIDDNTTYTLSVTNTSNVPLDGVHIIDTFPSEFTFQKIDTFGASSWTCQAVVSNSVDCTYDGNLSVNESASIAVTLKATTLGSGILNTATLKTAQTADKNASKSIDIIEAYSSNLTINKTSSQDVILENDTFSYLLSVTNSGASEENNLTITDTIPSDFTVDANISSGAWNCTLSGNDVTCLLDSLASGQSADDINVSVTAPSTINSDKVVTNTAKVTSLRNSSGVSASKDVTLLSPSEAIKIHLSSAPNPVYEGEEFIYSLFITNNSQKTTDSVTLYDTLPVDVVLNSIDSGGWGCDYNSSTHEISCDTNGQQLTGTGKDIYFHVTAPNYEVNVTNHVQLSTDLDPYTREANVTTTVLAKTNALIFSQATVSKDPVNTNETFTYTIKVKNDNTGSLQSNIDASNIKVTLSLDNNLSLEDINASGWTCSSSASVVECLYDSNLSLGTETTPIKIDVSSTLAHYAITDVKVVSDKNSAGKMVSIPVDILEVENINLSLSVSDDKDPVAATGNYSYLLSVSNSGSSATANDIEVVIETTSSDNFTYNSVSGVGWVCTQSAIQVHCHLDSLASDSTSNFQLNVTAPDINDTVSIKASVSSSLINEVDSSDNSASESTQVLQFDKNADNLREFTQVLINGNLNTNIFGDVFTIGNQAICDNGSTGTCTEPEYAVNDWVYQEYANLDASSPYESSTSATLDITDNDEVVWAGLYWMGIIDRNAGDSSKIDRANYVYLRHESESLYIEVESDITKFNWKNDVTWGSDTFGYQGVSDVTEYVKSHKKGVYWVGDIQTTQGYNLSAGWSLVVVVQDKTQTRKLKNITLFDGFQAVWKNDEYEEAKQYPDFVKQTVSGFLTPNSGAVNSKLSLFGVEGDLTLKDSIAITDENNVTHKLSNTLNPIDDIVNGTISHDGVIDTQRTPALTNTSGIDIDTFDVSSIIGNGQSTTDITVASEGDRFYLGMFAFSTELYLPKMCYVETMTNADYSPLTNNREFYLGDKVGFEVSIQNDENETARNVVLKTEVDVIYQDTNESVEIQNVGEASYSSHNDLWESTEINSTNAEGDITPQTLFSARVGVGADSVKGGNMDHGDKVYSRYNGIIDGMPDTNLTQNIYKISYEIENMPAVVETTISKCFDFNQSIYISQAKPKGFSITHAGGLTDGVSDNSGNENHLYTQLVDTDFQVDIVSLESDFSTSRVHRGVVRLDLADVNATIPEDATEEVSEGICKSYATLASHYVSFSDMDRITQTLAYHDSGKNLGLRILYPVSKYKDYATWSGINPNSLSDFKAMLDASRVTACQSECGTSSDIDTCRNCVFNLSGSVSKASCSSDVFAIRPKTIMMDANETTLKGGRDYNLTLEANASSYNQNFAPNSMNYELLRPIGCGLSPESGTINSNSFSFADGNASIATFTYHNIGDINVSLVDTLWTLSDQNSTDSTMSDCIMGSVSNVLVGGKYGCNIQGVKKFSFVPSRFKNEVNLQNDDNTTFTYLDDAGTRRARAFMTITALLDDDTTASNYTAGCYAKDINYTFGPATSMPSMQVYSDERTQQLAPNHFKTGDGNFSSGEAFPILGINFARSKTTAVNPFDLNSSSLYIYLEDEDGVEGDGFENDVGVAKYYYARLYAPDYLSIESSNFRAGLFYEVYCDEDGGCDKGAFNMTGLNESRDHVNWYIFNANHKSTYGDYDASSVVSTTGGLTVTAPSSFAVDLTLSSSAKRPYCDRISLRPDAWFAYDKHNPAQADKLSFKACFISTGSWAGTGDIGMTVDSNISKKKNTKIDW